jgi:hypothetical protein
MRRSAGLVLGLLAALATASCTSDGLMPPGDVGTSEPTAQSASNLAAQPTLAAAPAADSAASPMVAGTAQLGAEPVPAFSGSEPSTAGPQGDGGPIAAVATQSRIELAPITGATSEAAAPLTQRLAERARERGIGIAGNGAFPTYILKGYFSEVDDGASTTVIYVWDVLDPSGNRLHRIQGSAKTKGAGGWAAVSAKTMQAIADRTIDDFSQWLSGRAG